MKAFLILMSFAVLAGCGGAQAAMSGATPQLFSSQSNRSSEPPTQGDLLYALTYSGNHWVLHSFSFPGGEQISRQRVHADGQLCSDKSGDFFLPAGQEISEYAHGGKKPIAILGDSGHVAIACAVDSLSGNLAVTNNTQSASGNVAVYTKAKGSPKFYSDSQMYSYGYCTYDGQGNLFVDGWTRSEQLVFAELSKGASSFTNVTLDKPVVSGPIQWDGQYIAVQSDPNHIDRVQFSGSNGSVVSTIRLADVGRKGIRDFWIQGDVVAATGWNSALWNYPAGGKPIAFFSERGHVGVHLLGVTVSVAPSGAHIRK